MLTSVQLSGFIIVFQIFYSYEYSQISWKKIILLFILVSYKNKWVETGVLSLMYTANSYYPSQIKPLYSQSRGVVLKLSK